MGIVALIVVATVLAASEPTYGEATVNGDIGEWDLEKDFFADMLLAGGQGGHEEILASLYLRYDCMSKTLTALVLTDTNLIDVDGKEEHFIKINGETVVNDQEGIDGVPPNFAWVGLSSDQKTAQGFEASTQMNLGTHSLLVHTLVLYDNESQTAATEPLTLTLDCRSTAIELSSFTTSSSKEESRPWTEAAGAVIGGLALGIALVTRRR